MTENIMTFQKESKPEILFNLNHSGRSDSDSHLSSNFKDRARLFNRFLWKNYSRYEMEIRTNNATHIFLKYRGAINPYAIVKSIDILLDRHKILSSSNN